MNINFSSISKTVSKALSRVKFKLRKHSPDILFGAGMIGTLGGTIMVGIASSKVKEVATEAKAKTEKKLNDIQASETLTPAQKRAETTKAYIGYGMEFVKLYGPSVAVLGLSGTSLVMSHVKLKERVATLAAAYTTVAGNLKKYKDLLEEKYDMKELPEGNETKKEAKEPTDIQEVPVLNDSEDPYSFLFDNRCAYWDRNPEISLAALQSLEKMETSKLRAHGYLFLSDVLKDLKLPETRFSRMVGWIYDPDNVNWKGDGYVDFGLNRRNNEGIRRFRNGEPNVWLSFNCDGYIFQDFELANAKSDQ